MMMMMMMMMVMMVMVMMMIDGGHVAQWMSLYGKLSWKLNVPSNEKHAFVALIRL